MVLNMVVAASETSHIRLRKPGSLSHGSCYKYTAPEQNRIFRIAARYGILQVPLFFVNREYLCGLLFEIDATIYRIVCRVREIPVVISAQEVDEVLFSSLLE